LSAPLIRCYIDTSVFIWYLHSAATEGYAKAEKFLKDIASGKYQGVTSTLVRFEYRGYLKEEKAMVNGANASKKELDLLIDKLERLIEDFGIEEDDADVLLGESWIDDCEDIVTQCQPTLVRDEWMTMKGTDAIHAVVANRARTQQLATLDHGFKSLRGAVSPFVLWDVY
jgi:predicted nucleic acid-binding protein